jgi:DnaJ family protein C protein 3
MLYLSETTSSPLTPLKQCLHFDPDSKTCKKLFRSLKKLDKDLSQVRNFIEGDLWRKALNILDPRTGSDKEGLVKRITDLISDNSSTGSLLPDDSFSRLLTSVYGWTCKAYTGTASFKLAKPFCTKVLERDPENVDGMIGLGESLLKEEKYEDAVRYLNTAFEKTGRSDRKILESLQKAQRLLKVSKTKDYYKVLEVSRDADLNTIKKSYRRLVRLYHPDKPGGSEEKMAALNEAWEVLSNEELKARYDQGDDPNDPMSGHHHQQQQHYQQGNPFQGFHGGNPFQQGAGGGSFFNDFFAGAGQQQGGPRVKFQWG